MTGGGVRAFERRIATERPSQEPLVMWLAGVSHTTWSTRRALSPTTGAGDLAIVPSQVIARPS